MESSKRTCRKKVAFSEMNGKGKQRLTTIQALQTLRINTLPSPFKRQDQAADLWLKSSRVISIFALQASAMELNKARGRQRKDSAPLSRYKKALVKMTAGQDQDCGEKEDKSGLREETWLIDGTPALKGRTESFSLFSSLRIQQQE